MSSRAAPRATAPGPPTMAAPRSSGAYHFVPLYARCSMVWPAARTKTSSLFTLQEVTLGPALKEPPRSSQSLHCGLLPDGAAENVAGHSLNGLGGAVVARAVGREIKKRPVPASSNTTLAKITSNDDRRWPLIRWGSTTAPYPSGYGAVSFSSS